MGSTKRRWDCFMSSLYRQTRLSENHPRRFGEVAGCLSSKVKQSAIRRQSNGRPKFNVSVDRMRLLIQAFGADEEVIAEVLRLTGNYKGPWK